MNLLDSPNKILYQLLAAILIISCSPRKQTEVQEPPQPNPTFTIPPKDSQSLTKVKKGPVAAENIAAKVGKKENSYEFYQQKLDGFKFEAFLVKVRYYGKAAALDLVSHEDARYYRKTLSRGIGLGSNFAGEYTLVSINCGSACQVNYVIETKTGKVLDKVPSNSGVSFRANSRLLVVNPPKPTPDYPACTSCGPEVYVLEKGLLYKAKLVK